MIEGLFEPMHLLVIGGIALLVFGPSRLPELGRVLGQAIRSFKAGLEEHEAAPEIAPTQPAETTELSRDASNPTQSAN